ncbi:hypothetical protein ACSBR1_013703 [Camellia fascicularis]
MHSRREGCWISVVKQRERQVSHSSWYEDRRAGLFTLFVDNLPESMDSRSLYKLFSKFGVVKDAFIPSKRRKSTNTRFGFIRYDCSISTRIAEQTNGLWVDDILLVVKTAEYGNGIDDRRNVNLKPARQPESRKPFVSTVNTSWNQRIDGRTFADVIKSTDSRCPPKTTIKVEEIGNGWLFENLIMRLKTEYSIQEVKNELKKRGMLSVLVREGSGRDAIISFNSREDLLKEKSQLEVWFHDWCEYITEWHSGMHLQQERYVWIRCYGVPLNLWNSVTFKKIGSLWGVVVILNDNICSPKSFRCGRLKLVTGVMDPISTSLNLECKGRLYPIRVYEEYNSENALFSYKGTTTNGAEEDGCSKINHQPIVGTNLEVEGSAKVDDVAGEYEVPNASMACRSENNVGLEVGGTWSNASAVGETKDLGGNSNEVNTCVVESSSPEGRLRQKHWSNHINHTGMEVPIIEHNHDPQLAVLAPTVVDSQILTPGFIKSLSEPSKINPGICLEVDLRSVHSRLQPTGAAHGCVQPIRSKDYVPNSSSERLGCGISDVGSHSNNSFSYSPLFSAPINTRIKKGKRKVNKNPVFFGRFLGFARKIGQKGCGTSKGAMARSCAATNSNHNPQS